MVQIHEDYGVLYKLDSRLLIFKKTLISNMKALSHIRYMFSVVTDVHVRITWLTSSILSFKEDVDSFCEFMHVLASHEVILLIVLPFGLRNILLDVKNEICSHPRLAVPDDLNVSIWAYYSDMHVPPLSCRTSFLKYIYSSHRKVS